jgi:sirohydrochlorin ferrochelatase
MDWLIWIALATGSIFAGVLYVRFLTSHPLQMNRELFALMLLIFLLILLAAFGLQGAQRWLALPLGAALALGGYLAQARAVLAREDSRPLPALTRRKDDPGSGHTAVIYFTHGEPETYDPIGWINQFNEFDRQKIAFVPLIARPFFLYQLRKSYLRVGRSEHRRTHQRMLRSLEAAYRAAGDTTTRFYLCFLDDNPRPDAAAIQALNEGASRIVVSEVFLTISNHTAEGKELIEALQIEQNCGVPVEYTGPLYDSATLKKMFVQRANANKGVVDKSKIGVLLVGHGQPDEWDRQWASETEQEIGFRNEVLQHLERDGYLPQNLGLAWMEFKQPKPAEKIESLVRNGVQEILYFSAAISADSMHSQYDVPHLVEQAKVPAHIRLVNLGAWGDDPLVIQAIQEKIDAALGRISAN